MRDEGEAGMNGDRGGGEVLLFSWGVDGAMFSLQKLATCEVTKERELRQGGGGDIN